MILKDLTGQRFGRLIVLERTGTDTHHVQWLCKCDCGKTTITNGDSLKAGLTESCGCLHKEIMNEQKGRPKKSDEVVTLTGLYAQYKSGAKKRNLSFALTKSGFKQIVLQDCFYCGCKPEKRTRKYYGLPRNFEYNGIDRLDNSKGYVPGNCVPCCKICNFMKKRLSLTEFLEKINRIAAKFGMWSNRK
jgi:hypothetical protein